VIRSQYDAGLRSLDFAGHPDEACDTINGWVRYNTQGLIDEILAEGMCAGVPLILTNAIYFYGAWKYEFDVVETSGRLFTLLDGTVVTVPMMYQTLDIDYGWGEGWEAVSIPYDGEQMEMLVIMPVVGVFSEVEESLSPGLVASIDASMAETEVKLYMPRFQLRNEFELKQSLTEMGMSSAFTSGTADFSGIDGTRDLFIDEVIHQAYVSVDEEGTQAAAATAVIVDVTTSIGQYFVMDRPFIFLIRDVPTGAVLFLGRVLDPR
jgi:serpin B